MRQAAVSRHRPARLAARRVAAPVTAPHCARSTSTGFMRAARRAGTRHAARITTDSTADTATSVNASSAGIATTLLETMRTAGSQRDTTSHADDEGQQGLAKQEHQDVAATGAERRADANLPHPPCGGVRDDAVEADRGQQETEEPRHRQDARAETPWVEDLGNLLPQRPRPGQVGIGMSGEHGVPHRLDQVLCGSAASPDQDAASGNVRLLLDRRAEERGAAVLHARDFDFPGNADDLHPPRLASTGSAPGLSSDGLKVLPSAARTRSTSK
jgi:hypothetical protein